MLFHAAAILEDRQGHPMREPKHGAKPNTDAKTGAVTGYDDDQLRDITHGDVAMMALDASLSSDEDELKADKTKWIKTVMKREAIAAKIAKALRKGDGWAELKAEGEADVIISRLAQFAVARAVSFIGPVMAVLDDPPESKPGAAPKVNGAVDSAHMAAASPA